MTTNAKYKQQHTAFNTLRTYRKKCEYRIPRILLDVSIRASGLLYFVLAPFEVGLEGRGASKVLSPLHIPILLYAINSDLSHS